eukprot:15462490-Alexandrium_andersonii.AAC.1
MQCSASAGSLALRLWRGARVGTRTKWAASPRWEATHIGMVLAIAKRLQRRRQLSEAWRPVGGM